MKNIQAPLLLINCKNYGVTGELAERVAKAAVHVLEERRATGKKQVTIAVAVPATDVYRVANLGLVPVFAEHLDSEGRGATTGAIIAEDLLSNGAIGSLINHSENPYHDDELAESVSRARKTGLVSVVCAKDAKAAFRYARLKPDFIAMEPPGLIGGNISVSTAQPSLITDTVVSVRQVADIPVLVGAGVKNATDVKKGIELGAVGVLVASGVTKAQDVAAAIRELASGFD